MLASSGRMEGDGGIPIADLMGRGVMQPRSPVVLLVLVETKQLRWFVAGLSLDGQIMPLLCSEEGNLARYRDLPFEEQVTFLRHRFCGVLQRGCDRLWGRGKKACHFVFVFESVMAEPSGTLTQVLADHFVEWMLNPPVSVFVSSGGFDLASPPRLNNLAGLMEPSLEKLLQKHLYQLLAIRTDLAIWELSPSKIVS